ncbi:MAG: caspase family protein, partial [Phycisphaerae bacterium]|nr:caspase family protein [Phycisphaerae bacterium]
MQALQVVQRLTVCGLVVALLCGCDRSPDSGPKTEGQTTKPDSVLNGVGPYALLVGCSKYDHLPPKAQLQGPAHDVELVRDLLIDQFGFHAKSVRTLYENPDKADGRPIKANIEREFKRIAQVAKKGDQVAIFLSGHGTQQPDDDPKNPEDPEPDGFDEVFCPADTKASPFAAAKVIPNGISDDEIRQWVGAIRKKGASVWIVVDSCHSGTAVRGSRVYRQLQPEDLLPKAAIAAGHAQRTVTRSVSARESEGFDTEAGGGLVAIYAAQPHEPTFEVPLPFGHPQAKPRGILTYTLVEVLRRASSKLTYDELVQRIRDVYVMVGVNAPTPLIEGGDRHREVLGQKKWLDRSRITLKVAPSGDAKIDLGSLHGVTVGSVLAVYPPAGEKNADQLIGHVKIVKTQSTFSLVEPCAFHATRAPQRLPLGGRCQFVTVNYGDLRVRVAIDPAGVKGFDLPAWDRRLLVMSRKLGSVFQYKNNAKWAQWLVRPVNGKMITLVPAHGWAESPEAGKGFGPVPIDGTTEAWLQDRLGRIARAQNLLRLCGQHRAHKQRGFFDLINRIPA